MEVEAPIAKPPLRKLALIDASGLIFRAYHALPPLTTSRGVPIHAVLGFARMVMKLLKDRNPSHAALCFDLDSRDGRAAIDPNYKANREETPDDLVSQFSLIREVARAFRLPIVEVRGWEADDVIATLAERAAAENLPVEVLTSDKDFIQLLRPGVAIFDPMKNQDVTEESVRARYGIAPDQWCDFQALIGDPVDNIPNVPGIGGKTAAKLLGQFKTVEALIDSIASLPPSKVKASLAGHVDQIGVSRRLATLRRDLSIETALDDLERREIDVVAARTLFTELEFSRLVDALGGGAKEQVEYDEEVLTGEAGLQEACRRLAGQSEVVLEPWYQGDPRVAALEGFAVATGPTVAWALRLEGFPGEAARAALGPVLAHCAITTFDSKALDHLLHRTGFGALQIGTDVMLLSYLINPMRKVHSLSDIARERLGLEIPKSTLTASDALAWVGAIRAMVATLWLEADERKVSELARTLEFPLARLLACMERRGMKVNRDTLWTVSTEVAEIESRQLKSIAELAGHSFNVASPAQLAKVLFEEVGLKVLKRNKTGPSTDHEVLEKLAREHPLPRAIIEYRAVAKLRSTYLDTLPKLIEDDGRIHTTFMQALAATGRLASTGPNLQNIPIRTDLGRRVRSAFVAEQGSKLISADYSQIELRILAHLTEDTGLLDAFTSGDDVHRRTAALVFGTSPGEVTEEQRRSAKMVNYGIAYGLSAHGLGVRLGLPTGEAAGIIEAYFQRFPGIAKYIEDTVEKARSNGFVETIDGRRRYLPDIHSKNRAVSSAAERAAINMPIQGTAADLVKRAMLAIEAKLTSGWMLMQVHDELLFEAPDEDAKGVAALARAEMTNVLALKVPLVVDVKIGDSWANIH